MKENLGAVLEKVYATASSAGEFASKTVAGASKKAGEILNTSKLKLKILDIRTDMDMLCKEVGEIVWAEHRDEEVDSTRLRALLLALDDKKEELDSLSETLQETKGRKHCENCGAANPKENAFCASCGNEF